MYVVARYDAKPVASFRVTDMIYAGVIDCEGLQGRRILDRLRRVFFARLTGRIFRYISRVYLVPAYLAGRLLVKSSTSVVSQHKHRAMVCYKTCCEISFVVQSTRDAQGTTCSVRACRRAAP